MFRLNRSRAAAFFFCLFLAWALAAPAWAGSGFLYEVRSDRGVSYLAGSVHLAGPDFYPLPPAMEEAFDRTEVLAVEADILHADRQKLQDWIMAHGFLPEGQNLADHISPRTRDKMAAMGLAIEPLQQVRPWLAAITLQVQAFAAKGLTDEYGLDMHFLQKAADAGRPIEELEGMMFQQRLFQDLTPGEQDLFLYYTLEELGDLDRMMGQFLTTWKEGDADGFAEVFFKGFFEYPELAPLEDKIIFDRNRRMADRVRDLLAGGRSYFIVVGAGHLVGDRGLVKILRDSGLEVEQK